MSAATSEPAAGQPDPQPIPQADELAVSAGVRARLALRSPLEQLTFGWSTRAKRIGIDEYWGSLRVPMCCEAFVQPVVATYIGSVAQARGRLVDVIGECACIPCARLTHLRFVARIQGTAQVLTHARGESFALIPGTGPTT